jgi:hypothetical protein
LISRRSHGCGACRGSSTERSPDRCATGSADCWRATAPNVPSAR